MENADLMWLAGLLEGEGNFAANTPTNRPKSRRIVIQLMMTDRDVVERVALLMNSPGVYARTQKGRKVAYQCMLSGHRACELMQLLLPYMGARRSAQIRAAIAEWKNRPIAQRETRLPATCHPDRPHRGNGLCDYCYRHQRYLNKDIPKRAALRAARTRDVIFV